MEKQFSYYDLVGSIAPGAVLYVAAALLASVVGYSPGLKIDGAAALGLGVVLVYVLGQLLQALASMLEPFYYWLWRGKPSERLLSGSSTRMDREHLDRLSAAIGRRFAMDDPLATESARTTFFRLCISLGHQEKSGRLAQFQGSYALHRGLLTAGLLSFVSALVIAALHLGSVLHLGPPALSDLYVTLSISAVLLALEFYRARQRAYYFAAQVLDSAYIVASGIEHVKEPSEPAEEDE